MPRPSGGRDLSVIKAAIILVALSEHWACAIEVVRSLPPWVLNFEVTQSELLFEHTRYRILRNDDRALVATRDSPGAVAAIIIDKESGQVTMSNAKTEFSHDTLVGTCKQLGNNKSD